ncbi:unnamed protein product [Pylaiella littoralis]
MCPTSFAPGSPGDPNTPVLGGPQASDPGRVLINMIGGQTPPGGVRSDPPPYLLVRDYCCILFCFDLWFVWRQMQGVAWCTRMKTEHDFRTKSAHTFARMLR